MAMEDSGMMSPADIAALTRGNTGFGGDGISWLVLILLFFGFMGGGWGGRYGNGELGQYATAASQQDILFGQHFGQINDRLTNIGNGICGLGYDLQGNIAGLGKDVALGQANLQLQASNNAAALASQLSQCCCTTQRGIDSVNYNGAINTAAINKNIDDKFAALEKAGLERQTKDLYSASYKELLNDNAIDFACFVKENLVLDVSEELAFAESLYMELENCDYDMVYLAEIQPGYSKKFKK